MNYSKETQTPQFCGSNLGYMIVNPLFDLVLGNTPGARKPNNAVGGRETCAAVATRAQACNGSANSRSRNHYMMILHFQCFPQFFSAKVTKLFY